MNNNALNSYIENKYNIGVGVENDFVSLAKKNGFTCNSSSKYEDVNQHWDFELIKDDHHEFVDVKGMKDVHNDGFTWVELKNVLGKVGWLYAKKLNAIVFEKDDRFDFVGIEDLRNLIDNNIINKTGLVFSKPKDITELKYYRYQRLGRSDIIVLVPFHDIDKLVYRTFIKE